MRVVVKRSVEATPEAVARVMFDPTRDPDWIGGALSARLVAGASGAEIGARVERQGRFLGRRFAWITEVVEHEPARRLRLRHIAGPFQGEVSYDISPAGSGSIVGIANEGSARLEPLGMGWLVRLSVARDLERLSRLVARRIPRPIATSPARGGPPHGPTLSSLSL